MMAVKENKKSNTFDQILTFHNNEDAVDFFDDGDIFEYLDNNEQHFDIEFEDYKDISSALIEKLKCNCHDKVGLMLFNNRQLQHWEKFNNHSRSKKLALMKNLVNQELAILWVI